MCLFKYGLNKLTLSAARTDAGSLLHKAAAEAENLLRVNCVLDAGTIGWSWLEERSIRDGGVYGFRLDVK